MHIHWFEGGGIVPLAIAYARPSQSRDLLYPRPRRKNQNVADTWKRRFTDNHRMLGVHDRPELIDSRILVRISLNARVSAPDDTTTSGGHYGDDRPIGGTGAGRNRAGS